MLVVTGRVGVSREGGREGGRESEREEKIPEEE